MSKDFGEIRDEQAEEFLRALQNGHDGQGLTIIAASYPSMRNSFGSGDNRFFPGGTEDDYRSCEKVLG